MTTMNNPQESTTISPPHDTDAEKSALGCCFLEPKLASQLAVELFYDNRNRLLAEALIDIAKESDIQDSALYVTLYDWLKRRGKLEEAGGTLYFGEVSPNAPCAGALPFFLDILRDYSGRRKLLAACGKASLAATLDLRRPCLEVATEMTETMAPMLRSDKPDNGSLESVSKEVLDDAEAALLTPGIRGILTGFSDLDNVTNGLHPGTLFLVAARPSTGKTSFCMNIAERVAVDAGKPVGVFTLEMSNKELLLRMICCRARVNSMRARRGRVDKREQVRFLSANSDILKSPLKLYSLVSPTLAELGSSVRDAVDTHGIQLAVVDYLGFIRTGESGLSRYEETTKVSNGLKALANETEIPFLVACQLNRESEKDKREPNVSDLRDSGSLEQDADMIGLLHLKEGGKPEAPNIDLIIGKNRNGPLGRVHFQFQREFTRFELLQQDQA
jgi:replicative DNA helicase